MPLFALKSISQNVKLDQAAEDYKAGKRAEQYRLGAKAIYFPAFPGTQYLPFEAVERVKVRSTALSVTGTCGKQIPMVCVRLHYDGEFYKDFLFEKEKNADRVLAALLQDHPNVPLDKDIKPYL